jgi:type I restriction enzyme R subunit
MVSFQRAPTALFKYKLNVDEELFEKAYSYIKQYY